MYDVHFARLAVLVASMYDVHFARLAVLVASGMYDVYTLPGLLCWWQVECMTCTLPGLLCWWQVECMTCTLCQACCAGGKWNV